MKERKKHWYHCCQHDHGREWVAEKMVSQTAVTVGEPKVPRLCVCPSIALCFMARYYFPNQLIYIYRTAKERSSVTPFGVRDAVMTRERWLIPPVNMILLATVPLSVVWRATAKAHMRSLGLIRERAKTTPWRHKIQAYAEAVKALGTHDSTWTTQFDRSYSQMLTEQRFSFDLATA